MSSDIKWRDVELAKMASELETEIAKLRKKQAAERSILEKWPADVPFYGVYAGPLYGRVGSVSLAPKHVSYYLEGNDPRPTLEEVAGLLAKLPPVPMVLVKEGCTSFRTAASVEAEAPQIKERGGDITPVAPVVVKVEGGEGYGPYNVVEWHTDLGGVVVEVEAVLRHLLYRQDINARYTADGRISQLLSCNLRPVRPTLMGHRYIKWGTGFRYSPNHFTVYWEEVPSDPVEWWQRVTT